MCVCVCVCVSVDVHVCAAPPFIYSTLPCDIFMFSFVILNLSMATAISGSWIVPSLILSDSLNFGSSPSSLSLI